MKASVSYHLDDQGCFSITDPQSKKPFSNFFPGIAGEWGIPMWVFYVNRGQGIASFGIESKDKAIMEFQPANKAYRYTNSQGFRTFFKIEKSGKVFSYEAFQPSGASPYKVTQTMKITSHDLTIEEVNSTLGLVVSVNYFTVPEESFAGLVRQVTVKNISKSNLSIEMIDGLPSIIPYGQNDWVMKNMCRTIEAWYKVRNMERQAPYYQLDVEAADVPQVKHIKEGNFYFAFDGTTKTEKLLDPIVEASLVFGQATDFSVPVRFTTQKKFVVEKKQQTDNRTPSAMCFSSYKLKMNQTKNIISMIGFTRSVDELNQIVKKVVGTRFIEEKKIRNKEIIDAIKNLSFTSSSSDIFNAYAGQTFLDNVLRGGLPISLQTGEGPAVFNVFSRKHGDLERDYNAFRLSPTYLSQGNGNYRDVNQNRRNDVWYNTDLKESSIVNFFSLTQADGYNPLVVCGMAFVAENSDKLLSYVEKSVKKGNTKALASFLQKGFMPGDLFNFMIDQGIVLKSSPRQFLAGVLGLCQKFETAQHGEGFWVDHWTYNIDLLESYLALYPEHLEKILLQQKDFTFYHNAVYVRPRDERYVLTNRGVRQYDSLHEGKEDKDRGHKLRVRHGQGEVYRTNLLVKMLCLLVNKVATLDPDGIGVEMEANKPGWYDSLNGLPGLIGSSICETFEIRRFALFVFEALEALNIPDDEQIQVFEELKTFIAGMSDILTEKLSDLDYWKRSNTIKEDYRAKVREGISGIEKEFSIEQVRLFLKAIVRKIDAGVEKAKYKNGLFATYFYYKVSRYEFVDGVSSSKEGPYVRPLAFERHDMPLFLEGFVHALRCETQITQAKKLHQAVKTSALYDKKLQMYALNADLTPETEEIGRTRVFPRGWLENGSIWLHMEYKYILELLRRGLHADYHEALSTCCVAFMDPNRYGRSILENSSFIVASTHPDEDIHGQGNVARLSGSTAEFVHMWMMMNAGEKPFRLSETGELILAFQPCLKGWMFIKEKKMFSLATLSGQTKKFTLPAATYAFNFMGRVLVVYHNKAYKDTFGVASAAIVKITLTYQHQKKVVTIDGAEIKATLAQDVRDGKVERIDIWME